MRHQQVELPSKFDFKTYYLNQAAGGPTFPIYRARQRGGFIGPLIKRHGIPFLKWLGKQAASFASGASNKYLEKGELSKDDFKQLLKKQGKAAATTVLDKVKEQVGSGMMNYRRDGRLSAILPDTTNMIDRHMTRFSPTSHAGFFPGSNGLTSSNVVKTKTKRKRKQQTPFKLKKKKTSKKRSNVTPRKKRIISRKKILSKSQRSVKSPKKKTRSTRQPHNKFAHTIFE